MNAQERRDRDHVDGIDGFMEHMDGRNNKSSIFCTFGFMLQEISSINKENKITVNQLHQTSNGPVNMSHNEKQDTHHLTTAICTRGSKDAAEFSSNTSKLDKRAKNVSVDETKMGHVDSTSKFESVRNIDARQLNIKYVFMAVLVFMISVFAASLFQYPDSRF